MFTLAESFGIKPWEINDDHEVYQEDLIHLIEMRDLKHRVQTEMQQRATNSSGPVGQGRTMHVR